MTDLRLHLRSKPLAACSVERAEGVERLGEASTFVLELEGPATEPIAPADVLRAAAAIDIDGPAGTRTVSGIIMRFVVIATDHAERARYRATLRPAWALLELRRPSRIFQGASVPSIVEQVAAAAGYEGGPRKLGTHAERKSVAQYQETDAAFVRRLCEDEGIWFRFDPTEDGEALVLEDASASAKSPYTAPLTVVDRASESATFALATGLRRLHRRRPGRAVVRDYDPDHPAAPLEGEAEGGLGPERDVEVYVAPGGFLKPDDGTDRAELLLESLRADATLLRFRTNAFALAPGHMVDLALAPDFQGRVRAEGEHFVVGVTTRWSRAGECHAEIEAIPKAVPFRLPRVTPRPTIAGVQSAFVSGEKGQEIHPDTLGRVHLRFHWDLFGPSDHKSSIPIRVAQPHAPGALVVPRVGWEVFVTFDDGDPDRPFVIGRSYNQKQPPPLTLPANKTVTSIATDSSPGKGARTVVQFDDAAGKEHVLINAPFAHEKVVANDQKKATLKNENEDVAAHAKSKVGGDEKVQVGISYLMKYGTRRIQVGAAQYIGVGGSYITKVGSERVVVVGAVGEQVGNPAVGAFNVLWTTLISKIPGDGVLSTIAKNAAGFLKVVVQGAFHGGVEGAKKSAGGAALGIGMGFIPGGEAILATVTGKTEPSPWDHGLPPEGAEPGEGGGHGEGGGEAGPEGPGPGHRATIAKGSYTELVRSAYGVATPGEISWVTMASSKTYINGSHSTKAHAAGIRLLGGMSESVGSLTVDSKDTIVRKVLGGYKQSVDGALSIDAGGEMQISAKTSLTFKVDGTLQIGGSPVTFKCGDSVISTSSSGVKISASTIKVTGISKQSGSLTHK